MLFKNSFLLSHLFFQSPEIEILKIEILVEFENKANSKFIEF